MRSNSTARGVLAIAVIALTGCMDLEEDIVSGVTGEFFGTPEGAEAAITGAYSRLRDWAGQERQLALFTLGTDSWETSSQTNVDLPFSEYTNALAANMANAQLRDDWASRYAAINATNTAIHFIDASSEIPEPTKSIRLGEARFLRALNYFFLVRQWGDVPLLLEPTEGVILTGTRTPAEQVYGEAIIPDLEYAIDNLPAQQSEYGRATRGAAQMMLADVYLDNEMTAAELAEFGASPIDFLLDERERELASEELRWFVLTRTGKLVDRVQEYNTPASGNVQPHHVLRPIPQAQIDRVQGEFGQNPGYN